VAGPRRWAELHAAWRNAPVSLLPYWERHPPDILVLTHGVGRLVGSQLLARGWLLLHIDNGALVFVPQRPDTADLIEREGYRWL